MRSTWKSPQDHANESISKSGMTTENKHTWSESLTASFFMGAALSAHYFGYECARAASISLLASKDVGLGSEAFTYTVAVGSPAGAIVLYLYARSIKLVGPQSTLRISETMCLLLMTLMVLMFNYGYIHGWMGQLIVIVYYSYREIYVSLLSTQHWSFIATVLDTRKSGKLVSIAGSVSVSSALGGCAVEYLVHYFGVSGLLISSLLATTVSTICTETAYYLAQSSASESCKLHSFKPVQGASSTGAPKTKKHNIWIEFWHIMYRSSTLRLLYVEAVCHQLVANTLQLMFHEALRTSIADNAVRAVAVGRFFATVNVATCGLQLFVLPSLLSTSTLPQVLLGMPVVMLLTTVLCYVQPSLTSIMLSFGTMKVLEYSIMTSAGEMIYMPMSHDDRYLGKEVIRFFGQKLGKSWSSLMLSSAMSRLAPSGSAMALCAGAATLLWSSSTQLLSSHLVARDKLSVDTSSGSGSGSPVDVGDASPDVDVDERSCTTSESESTGEQSPDEDAGDIGLPLAQSPPRSPRNSWSLGGESLVVSGRVRRRRRVKKPVPPVAEAEARRRPRTGTGRPNAPSVRSSGESGAFQLGRKLPSSGFLVRVGSALESLYQLGGGSDGVQMMSPLSQRSTSMKRLSAKANPLPPLKE